MIALAAIPVFAEQPLASEIYSVRFKAPHLGAARAGLAWGDSMLFTVDVPAAGYADDEFGIALSYTYSKGDSVIARGTARCGAYDPAAVSVILRAWSSGASVETGTGCRGAVIPVDFDCLHPDSIQLYNPSGLAILTHSRIEEPLPPVEYADTANLSSVWVYLDRDTDPEQAFPGGYYRLGLTAPDSSGTRRLIYLTGASTDAAAWTPGRVKATLRATNFAGHYDLQWITASGRMAPAESFADIDDRTGILTVSFPLLRSSLRFRALEKLQ